MITEFRRDATAGEHAVLVGGTPTATLRRALVGLGTGGDVS